MEEDESEKQTVVLIPPTVRMQPSKYAADCGGKGCWSALRASLAALRKNTLTEDRFLTRPFEYLVVRAHRKRHAEGTGTKLPVK